jgi:predicted phosphodiesterase
MLRNESVDLVIHAGDLDYESAPHTWDNFLTANLGGMDLFAVKGNHDSNCDEGPGDAMGCVAVPERLQSKHRELITSTH